MLIVAGEGRAAIGRGLLPPDGTLPVEPVYLLDAGDVAVGETADGRQAFLLALSSTDLAVSAIEHRDLPVSRVAVIYDITSQWSWEDRRMKVLGADLLARRIWGARVVWYPVCARSREALAVFEDRIEIAPDNWPVFVAEGHATVRRPGGVLPPVAGFLAQAEGYLHDAEVALCRSLAADLSDWRLRWLARPEAHMHLVQELPPEVAVFGTGEVSEARFLWSLDALLVYPGAALGARHLAAIAGAALNGTVTLVDPDWIGPLEGLVVSCAPGDAAATLDALWRAPDERARLARRAAEAGRGVWRTSAEAGSWFATVMGETPAAVARP